MTIDDDKLTRLPFLLLLFEDSGMGDSLWQLAQDEGYQTAIDTAQQWQLVLESMIESMKDSETRQITIWLLGRVNQHLMNLTIDHSAAPIPQRETMTMGRKRSS